MVGRKKISVFRLLAAGIAGGLCGTAVSCLELSGNRSTDYGKKPGGLDFLGKRESSDKWLFDYNGCASPKKSVRMEKSVLSKGKGAWAAGLVSGDPAERSCGLAGALLSHRVEKYSVYGIFLCGSPLLCGGAREAAGDRKNEVSGPTFPERKIEGVYRDGGFRESSRGTCDGKAGSALSQRQMRKSLGASRQAS